MAVLRLKILGGFEVRLPSGDFAEIPIRKGRALLAYLALHEGQVMARAKLADLLWGDHGETQAQNNLRQTLTVLRKAVSPMQDEVLRADRQSVGLDHEHLEVDAVSFQELVASGTPHDLETAIALYRGDLLDGLEISSPGFEDWLENERRRLRELMSRALSALMEHKRASGDRQDAISLGQHLLTLDPLREEVHRALMVLYGELGQRQSALQQYQRCRELLESELGVEPEPETEALYQALRDKTASDDASKVPDTAVVTRWEKDDSDEPPVDDWSRRPPLARTSLLQRPGRWAAGASLVLVIGGVAVFGWLQSGAPRFEPAAPDRLALPQTDEPSIAALPLDDPSGEPGQDFFADAVTDDPIKEPSRLDDEEAVERGELASRVEQTPTSAERPAALNMPAAAGDADNPAEVGTAALELEFWNAIKDSSDAAAYEAYLETYPQGSFARLARLRAEQLATPATVAPPSDKPSADRQVASSPPADEPTPTAPAAAAPPPDKPSADRQVASSPSADEPARAAPDDGRLLSDWRLRVDIVKRAIAQSRAALRESRAVFGEFEIVDAAPVESNNRLVELKTVYTIKMNVTTAAGYRDKGIDNKIIYHQTVVVDRRNVTVVEVGDVVVGDDGSKFAKPQLNSVDDGPLLARQPDPPAWTQLGGG